MKKIVSVPECNFSKFDGAMKKIIKLAKKLNSGEIECNLIVEEAREYVEGTEEYVLYRDYEISGEAPTLNGYTLVAILERLGEQNLINHINKEIPLPEGLKDKANYCEHCNSNRKRKHLFILQDESGKIIQVGKSCAKDFTGGHKSPDAIAEYYAWFDEIEEEMEQFDRSFSFTRLVTCRDIIAYSAYLTDQEGYIKKWDGTAQNPSTTEKSLKIGKYADVEEIEKQGYFEKADKVIEWIKNEESNSDYILNLQVLVKAEIVDARKAGFLASAYQSYLRVLGKRKEQEKKDEVQKESEYVGEIGKRVDFKLTYTRYASYETQYGLTIIYFFHDENGNLFIWKTSNSFDFDTGETVELKGTIKDHSEYNGVKQNVLTRCKVKNKEIEWV